MPTIIDELVVRLTLQNKDLDSKSSSSKKKLNDLEKQAGATEKSAKSLGKGSTEAAEGAEAMGGAAGVAVGIVAALGAALIAAAAAAAAYADKMITTGAALNRLGENLDMSSGDIVAWGNAAELMGGKAGSLEASLSMLSKAQTQIQLTGESSLIPYFNYLGVSMADAEGKARPLTDVILSLASAAEGQDRAKMHNIFAEMGFNDDTINVMLQGRKELELTLSRQKEYAERSKAFNTEASKMQTSIVGIKQQFSLLALTLLQKATPAIEKILGGFQSLIDWMHANREFVVDFGKALAAIVGVPLAIAAGFAGFAALTNPIALVTGGIVALAAAIGLLWQDYQTWKRGGDSFIDWKVWGDRVQVVRDGIKSLRDEIGNLEKTATDFLNKTIPGFAKFDKWFTSKGDAKTVGNAIGGAAKSTGSVIAKGLGIKSGVTVDQARAQAIRVSAQTGISPDILLAQWEHETGNFTNRGAKSLNNLAGVNVPGGKGKDYRSFKSLDEFGDYYSGLMKRKYPGALGAQDVDTFATALKEGGYFSAPLQSYEKGMSSQLAGISGASSNVAAAGLVGAQPSAVADNSSTTHIGTVNINAPSGDAKSIADAFSNFLYAPALAVGGTR
jgi:hypothetical protein